MSLTHLGVGRCWINSTFALSTYIPLLDMIWPKLIPCVTMKWHFFQFLNDFLRISPKYALNALNMNHMYPHKSRSHPWIPQRSFQLCHWKSRSRTFKKWSLHCIVQKAFSYMHKYQKDMWMWSYLDPLMRPLFGYNQNTHLRNNKKLNPLLILRLGLKMEVECGIF